VLLLNGGDFEKVTSKYIFV